MTDRELLENIYHELKTLNKKKEPTQLVRMSTAIRETGRSKTWITEQRIAYSNIAIKEGGIYKYDILKLKQLAA